MSGHNQPRERAAEFEKTGWTFHPYEARVDGQVWLIGINDFPDEPLYTLYIDGRRVEDFNDWPVPWTRPGAEAPPIIRPDRVPRQRPIEWSRSASAECPYEADVEGERWVLRVNDFPAEAFYTLLADGKEREDFESDQVPDIWRLPGPAADDDAR
jgi:hypothetical protein